VLAEFLGTGLITAIVIGSGILAQQVSPGDAGLQLFYNVFAIVLGLTVVIVLFIPVSGSHFNPIVTVADWYLGKDLNGEFRGHEIGPYMVAQVLGGIVGTVFANFMFEVPTAFSARDRITLPNFVSEIVGSAFLIVVIHALVRTGRTSVAGPVIAAYIGAAAWFTSSSAFINPAVTIGRMFSDTFAGIAPASVLPFIVAQFIGLVFGIGLTKVLYPMSPEVADSE